MKVLKFGGSSVANAQNINRVIEIVLRKSNKQEPRVVVVSALGGVTDELIQLAIMASKKENGYRSLLQTMIERHDGVIKSLMTPKQRRTTQESVERIYRELENELRGIYLIEELSPRSLDMVMSIGERLSATIIGSALRSKGRACESIDSRELIITDDAFGSANVDIHETNKRFSEFFKKTKAQFFVMGGFIGASHDGIITTLGRGGSDYTASIAGAALNAREVEIWTDVDGVMTADPRKVKQAFPLSEISYEEAGELAHFGAKVIHPKTMKPARLKGIPIHIKNTFNPKAKGTKIGNGKEERSAPIEAISSLSRVALLHIQSNNGKTIGEIAARLFDALRRYNIEVLLTTQASYEQSLSIAVAHHEAQKVKSIIERAFELELQAKLISPVTLQEHLSIVAIVGKQMKGIPGISGKFFNTLGRNAINVIAIAQGSSELNVSAVVGAQDETRALQVVHEAFFGTVDDTLNVFLVGTGLIGSTLLRQMSELERPVQVCGIANNEMMLFDRQGISLNNWKQQLAHATPMNLQQFVAQVLEAHGPNSVFVDCTASLEVAAVYEQLLASGIAVVTPNKKANSGKLARFKALRETAQLHHTPFLYETNVGAALPVIRTIQGMVESGDEILTIEAILSGTLSYIFNTFGQVDIPFSAVVREAQKKGYTEPDPRDDLNGMDVARKILILARELGYTMELEQVKIKPFLPARCFSVPSVEQFFTTLKTLDSEFRQRKSNAQQKKKVLRFIATLKNKKASIELKEVGIDHPFYNLSGSDNIVAITSKRYCNTPLVIKGPGAGAEVTAGGVLADILSTVR